MLTHDSAKGPASSYPPPLIVVTPFVIVVNQPVSPGFLATFARCVLSTIFRSDAKLEWGLFNRSLVVDDGRWHLTRDWRYWEYFFLMDMKKQRSSNIFSIHMTSLQCAMTLAMNLL